MQDDTLSEELLAARWRLDPRTLVDAIVLLPLCPPFRRVFGFVAPDARAARCLHLGCKKGCIWSALRCTYILDRYNCSQGTGTNPCQVHIRDRTDKFWTDN